MDESSKKPRVIPKFKSFRPKAQSSPTLPPDQKPEIQQAVQPAEQRNELPGSQRSRHENYPRSGHAQTTQPSRSSHRSADTQAPIKQPVISKQPDEQSLYVKDLRGDMDNVKYGRLHRPSIPSFRRYGRGNVLGVPSYWRIDRAASDDKRIVLECRDNKSSGKGMLSKKGTRLFTPSRIVKHDGDEQGVPPHELEFIPVVTRKRKRGSESPDTSHNPMFNFRSLDFGSGKQSKNDVEDNEIASETSDDGTSCLNMISARDKDKNSELILKTKDSPGALQAWLDLIDHQDTMHILGQSREGEDLSPAEEKQLADVKISIYRQAMGYFGKKQKALETLWMGMLGEGEKAWQAEKLSSKLMEAIEEIPTSFQLQLKYLDFVQTNMPKFRYEFCKNTYIRLMKSLDSQILQSRSAPNSDLDQHCCNLAYTFLRLTMFIKQAGYTEYSIALWQAALEFSFFPPENPTNESGLDALEEFWECEVPRIGEANSKGWKVYAQSKDNEPPPPVYVQQVDVPVSRNLFLDFGLTEISTAEKLDWPGRSADDAGEDDPFHMVLFSDIRPFILPSMQQPNFKDYLLQAFLCYHDLPPLPYSKITPTMEWRLDPFIRRNDINNKVPRVSGSFLSVLDFKHRQITSEVLFDDAFSDRSYEPIAWAFQSLQSIVTAYSNNEVLAEYVLAFANKYNPSLAPKIAKRLLKSCPSSLRLYAAYGTVKSRDNLNSSCIIFSTAIKMSATLGKSVQREAIRLWRAWTYEYMRANNTLAARQILLSIGNQEFAGPGQAQESLKEEDLSRARSYLLDYLQFSISAKDYEVAVLHVELLALLMYFESARLSVAMDEYENLITVLRIENMSMSAAAEHLHQCRAQLIGFHSSRNKNYKPGDIRQYLSEALELFPNNSIILDMYNCFGLGVVDRLRSLFSGNVKATRPHSTLGWLVKLKSEFERDPDLGGTLYSVRSTFEKMLELPLFRSSPACWAAYFFFEFNNGDLDNARKNFFTGMSRVPWSKWNIMPGFWANPPFLTYEQQTGLYQYFEEKELRIHVNISNQLEEMKERRIMMEGGSRSAASRK